MDVPFPGCCSSAALVWASLRAATGVEDLRLVPYFILVFIVTHMVYGVGR